MEDRENETHSDWDDPLFKNAFLMEHKAEYVKKPKKYSKQTENTCIICKIVRKEEDVQAMEIFRNDETIIFLNIYPYTTGHILISPLNHREGYEELSGVELKDFNIILQRVIRMLKHYGKTESFNVGWNQGEWSGGSIAHFHAHVVPRYKNDINWIDIIAKSRTVLYSLETVEANLKEYREFLAGNKGIDEIFD